MSYDAHNITFLDVKVRRDNEGALCSSLYRKPTAGNAILHSSSFHPKTLINSIPLSQYLSIRHNGTDDTTFLIKARKLQDRLLQRGYSQTSLKKAYKGVMSHNRKQLLYSNKLKVNNNPI